MSAPPPDPQVLALAVTRLHAGLYWQLASFIMLIYDHMLTFSEEIERVWKQKITGASVLFLLNRYLTPLQFIVIVVAFQDPGWTKKACHDYVKFEGASTVALVAICELIMILRVYALYGRSAFVLVPLLCLWVMQITTSAIGIQSGFSVPLPPGIPGCILTGSSKMFSAVWWAPLITDSCIFILTLWKTREYIKNSRRSPTIDLFIRDGAMYFCAIFGANLLNTLIYFLAPANMNAVGASFSQLITSVMVSRLVLNLRSVSESLSVYNQPRGDFRKARVLQKQLEENTIVTIAIGNLGEEFQFSRDSDETWSSGSNTRLPS